MPSQKLRGLNPKLNASRDSLILGTPWDPKGLALDGDGHSPKRHMNSNGVRDVSVHMWVLLLMIETPMHYLLRTLNSGNYGIILDMGNAGFISSTVSHGKPKHRDIELPRLRQMVGSGF